MTEVEQGRKWRVARTNEGTTRQLKEIRIPVAEASSSIFTSTSWARGTARGIIPNRRWAQGRIQATWPSAPILPLAVCFARQKGAPQGTG